jgi:hypothetical protein
MRSAAVVLMLFAMLLIVWIALLLTPVARRAFERNMPALQSPYALKPTATSRKR